MTTTIQASLEIKKIQLQASKKTLESKIIKASADEILKIQNELAEVIQQLAETKMAISATKKAATFEVVDSEEEEKNQENRMKAQSEIEQQCREIIEGNDYHYIQRHHCYYKRTKKGELEDVIPGSLAKMHPCLQDRDTARVFDEVMVALGRSHHDINYSFRKLESDVLNLMKVTPIDPVKPDETFRGDYFDLLVKTASGEYLENIEHMERWITWKYLHPEDFALPALVMFKSGGAGKNLLMEMVQRVIWGDHAICKVEGEDFFDNFNDDQLGTALVFIDEMDFDKQNINKLKARVQSATWKVNGKFKRRWEVDTTMSFVIATNDKRGGIRVSRDNVDRRWSIMKCKNSLVEMFNLQFFNGSLSHRESAAEWEKVAEGFIKDKRQVAMWLYTLIEKYGKEEQRPSALHGADYEEICIYQKSALDDIFEKVFLSGTFDAISVDTLSSVANIVYKDLHVGAYKASNGSMVAHMIDEIKKHKLPIKFDPKKAYYNDDRQGRSKAWFFHESLEGTTITDNSMSWIVRFHDESTSMTADVDRASRMRKPDDK